MYNVQCTVYSVQALCLKYERAIFLWWFVCVSHPNPILIPTRNATMKDTREMKERERDRERQCFVYKEGKIIGREKIGNSVDWD